jgi:hypothetical protein
MLRVVIYIMLSTIFSDCLRVVMLSVILLSAVVLSAVLQSVVMLDVVILSVAASSFKRDSTRTKETQVLVITKQLTKFLSLICEFGFLIDKVKWNFNLVMFN